MRDGTRVTVVERLFNFDVSIEQNLQSELRVDYGDSF